MRAGGDDLRGGKGAVPTAGYRGMGSSQGGGVVGVSRLVQGVAEIATVGSRIVGWLGA